MTEPTRPLPLNPLMAPKAEGPWGCRGCSLFQYSQRFTPEEQSQYSCTLDKERDQKKNASFYMPGEGNLGADVMVILEYPNKSEDAAGQSFTGTAARIIRRNAKSAGIDSSGWRWEYAVRCSPPGGLLGKGPAEQLKKAVPCSRYLALSITKNKPKVIIAFGDLVTRELVGSQDAGMDHWCGRPQAVTVAGQEVVVYPMYAPWMIMKNDHLTAKYLDDFVKLGKFLDGDRKVAQDDSVKTVITDPEEAKELCQYFMGLADKGYIIAADLETSGLDPYLPNQRICVLSLGAGTKLGYGIMMNHDEVPWTEEQRTDFIENGMKPLLQHPNIKLRWHNGKFDVQWIVATLGFWPRDMVEDTMLTHYATNERIGHGLKDVAIEMTDMGDYDAALDVELEKQGNRDVWRFDHIQWDILGYYAALDAVATNKIAKALKPQADYQGVYVQALAYRAMPAFSATLTRMENNGAYIDVSFTREQVIPWLNNAAEDAMKAILAQPVVRQFIRDREQEERVKYLSKLAPDKILKSGKVKRRKTLDDLPPPDVKAWFEFNIGSSDQLKDLLYGDRYYNITPTIFTDKGSPSTNKEALSDLVIAGQPIAANIMEHRLDVKMVDTYGQPMVDRLEKQGNNLVHTSYGLHGTKTGRLNAKNPNLANIPNKANKLIKRMFTSRYGKDGVFISADYSQIELRVLAAASGDEKMIAAYVQGKDLHMITACLIFGMTEDEFKQQDGQTQGLRRTIAKKLNFGLCVSIGTQVLTNYGFKCIEDVLITDMLWDGNEWVTHGGVVFNGYKEVVSVGGIRCTADHEILSDAGWVTAAFCQQHSKFFTSGFTHRDGRLVLGSWGKAAANTRVVCTTEATDVLGKVAVYDIIDAGPNHRFQAGNLIVHNCYGIGAPGIVHTLKAEGVIISEEEAKKHLATFYSTYDKVASWIEGIERLTVDDLHSLTLFGRKRRLLEVESSQDEVVARALRQASNAVIQGSAGDMTMTALTLLDQEICFRRGDDRRLILPTVISRDFPVDGKWKRVHPIVQVYDMIGVDCHIDVAGEVVERLVWTMENVVRLAPLVWGDCIANLLAPINRVPIVADAEIGPSWRDLYPVGSAADVPKAMFIANRKKSFLDSDFAGKWTKEMSKAAEEEFDRINLVKDVV